MKKKIMILGSGVYQVPLIKKAKDMGLEVLVASILGPYPGISLADHFLEIDTTDEKAVVRAARDWGIDAVATTGTDVCIPSLGAVVDDLGLQGPSRKIACTVSSKTSFRAFLREQCLNSPEFVRCKEPQDALDFYKTVMEKMVIKPDDSSGSRGVTILEPKMKSEDVMMAYKNALKYSNNGLVCMESFIEGTEVGGDAFLCEGSLLYFTTTCKHMDGVLVRGHSLPGNLSKNDSIRVEDELISIATKLDYKNGPMNFDVMISPDRVTVLELGLRSGGNGIPELIYYCEGVNLMQWVLNYALGMPVKYERRTQPQDVSSYVFGSPIPGKLHGISSFDELQASVPEVYEMRLAKKPGERIDQLVNNADLIGYIIFKCGAADYRRMSALIRDALYVEVK